MRPDLRRAACGIEKVALHADLGILATLASALARAPAVPLAASSVRSLTIESPFPATDLAAEFCRTAADLRTDLSRTVEETRGLREQAKRERETAQSLRRLCFARRIARAS
jgi:hypothetical protein